MAALDLRTFSAALDFGPPVALSKVDSQPQLGARALIVYERPRQRRPSGSHKAIPTRDSARMMRGLVGVFPIDLDKIWSDAGEDRDRACAIVETFLETGDDTVGRMVAAQRGVKAREVRSAASSLQAIANAVGATRLADLADLIARRPIRMDTNDAVDAALAEHTRVRDFLISYRANRLRR